jgi:flagellar protein FliS
MNKFIGKLAYHETSKVAPKIDDAHGAITACLDTLVHNLKILSENPSTTSEVFPKVTSKCLTAIYILQSSLDFEKGKSIAENLFLLYDYVKDQVLANSKREASANINQAIFVITEIRKSWKLVQ